MVALGGSLADVGLIRPFGRSQELQADALGLGYMAAAGFEPTQAIAFWQRMAVLETGDRPPAFLATHPTSAAPIEALKRLLPNAGA